MLKILVASHKSFVMPDNREFVPVWTDSASGVADPRRRVVEIPADSRSRRAAAGTREVFRADSGDGTYVDDARYSELSAVHWAWKNPGALGDPDRIGLMHYRRWFLFKRPGGRSVKADYPDSGLVAREFGDIDIESVVGRFDICAPSATRWFGSMLGHFRTAHGRDYLSPAIAILLARHPGYAATVEAGLNRNPVRFYNMFVMTRRLFDEYCGWLFGLLADLEREIDWNACSARDARALGFVGERLTSIFVDHMRAQGCSVGDFPVATFRSTAPADPVSVAFAAGGAASKKNRRLAVAVVCPRGEIPLLGVTLASLAGNYAGSEKLAVFVFIREISADQKLRLTERCDAAEKLDLRFVDPAPYEAECAVLMPHSGDRDGSESARHLLAPLAAIENAERLAVFAAGCMILSNIADLEVADMGGAAVAVPRDFPALSVGNADRKDIGRAAMLLADLGGWKGAARSSNGDCYAILPGAWGVQCDATRGVTLEERMHSKAARDDFAAYSSALARPDSLVFLDACGRAAAPRPALPKAWLFWRYAEASGFAAEIRDEMPGRRDPDRRALSRQRRRSRLMARNRRLRYFLFAKLRLFEAVLLLCPDGEFRRRLRIKIRTLRKRIARAKGLG